MFSTEDGICDEQTASVLDDVVRSLYVDDGEIFAKEIVDALEADLQPLASSGLIARISKYDTNPANNPQSPERSRERG
jgi:hypothetical protein